MALSFNEINPRNIENKDSIPLVSSLSKTNSDSTGFILDRDWAKQAFLISDSKLGDSADIKNRYWSSASGKFTDTRLGCNIGVNSRPQFTRYSDVRVKGRLSGRTNVSIGSTKGNFGMGRYYSEAIDDPSQNIYLRFGVPQFNSLTNFIAKAFDPNMTAMARTGRAPTIFYDIAKVAGTAATVIAAPAIAIPILAGKVVSSFFTRPTSKFYTLKPTMHNYWSAVNLLVNTISINKGFFTTILTDDAEQKIGKPFKLDSDYMKMFHNVLPDLINENGYFDVYAIANKAQRLSNKLYSEDFERLNNGTATDFLGYVKKDMTGNGSHPTYISDNTGAPTLAARMNEMLKLSNYFVTKDGSERSETNPKIDPTSENASERKEPSFFKDYVDNLDSEFRDGSGWAVFKVDHTGSIGESFGNTVAESDLSNKLNSMSSDFRQAKFSFANGKIVDMPEIVDKVIGAAGDIVTGGLSGLSLGFSDFIMGMAGSGYLDIPKYWQSSSAQLPRNNYTIQLVSPYGNVVSQMQNIYIPLCMLLAGALPLSAGKQSYTSPFICQLFDRGRCQIRLGMIESLSITRGTCNLPFNTKGNPLAIDVSFSIVDLSSVMHMPISSGKLLNVDMTLDEDNILMDYLAVLAGQDMYTQIYPMPKAKLAFAKKMIQLNKLHSPAYWASMTHESATSGMLQYLTLGLGNAIEAGVRGSSIVTQ